MCASGGSWESGKIGKSMEIIRRVHGDHEGISRVSGGLGGSKGMCETRNTHANVGQGSGIQGDSVSGVGVPVCQGVTSDRLATRANKGKQRKTRGYEGNRNTTTSISCECLEKPN